MRKSGIELLRVISLFGVIMIHYWEQAATVAEGLNFHVLLAFRSISSCSVDVFLIISGYFLCRTNKRSLGKPVNLILQVSIINELAYLVKSYYGIEPPISLRHIASSLLPDSYYTTLFVVLYFISPYINKVIANLSHKEWNRLIICLLIFFSLYCTFCDLFFELAGQEIMGLSPITAWGSMQGFNIVNFTLLYLVGAYLRNNPIEIPSQRICIILFVSFMLIICWAELNTIFPSQRMGSAWVYHNPIVIIFAASLFLLFNRFTFESKFINSAAKSVYTCFLAHCQVISLVAVPVFARKSVGEMLLHYLVFAVLAYVICWVLWFFYDSLTHRIYKSLDKYQICYFE